MKRVFILSILLAMLLSGTAYADTWDLGTYTASNGQEITITSTGYSGFTADLLINYGGDWAKVEDVIFSYTDNTETTAVLREESSWYWELKWVDNCIVATGFENIRLDDPYVKAINGIYYKPQQQKPVLGISSPAGTYAYQVTEIAGGQTEYYELPNFLVIENGDGSLSIESRADKFIIYPDGNGSWSGWTDDVYVSLSGNRLSLEYGDSADIYVKQ